MKYTNVIIRQFIEEVGAKCVGHTFNKCYANYVLGESEIVVASSSHHCL